MVNKQTCDGFGGPFQIPSEIHVLTICVERYPSHQIIQVHCMKIEQATSRFITGYSSFSDVATKDIFKTLKKKEEISKVSR